MESAQFYHKTNKAHLTKKALLALYFDGSCSIHNYFYLTINYNQSLYHALFFNRNYLQ